MSRKLLHGLAALAAVGLTCGCGGLPGGEAGEVFQLAKNLVTGNSNVTLEEAAAVPYSSIGVRLGSSNQIMLVLASEENGRSLWTSAARIAIRTQNGRIIQTAGLGRDLGGVQISNPVAAADGRPLVYLADFPDLKLYSVRISCRRQVDPAERITILGAVLETNVVRESCVTESDSLDWSFRNTYWTDPETGFVWRSIQHTHPNLDPIEIEVLRAPA